MTKNLNSSYYSIVNMGRMTTKQSENEAEVIVPYKDYANLI